MGKNLNEDLYDRFGLKVSRDKVISGFILFLENEAWEVTYPMRSPETYREPYSTRLTEVRDIVLRELCRELFLDSSDYSWSDYTTGQLLDQIFVSTSFKTLLLNVQIFINILYKQEEIRDELERFIDQIKSYIDDFPILGITLKIYKTKSPQILASTSPRLDKEIMDTLGVLDTDKYEPVLHEFEAGLKIFTKAKTKSELKDVVEDMLGSCDEVVKTVFNDRNKGFKHAFDKKTYRALGLNNDQKEIFKNLKNWMDKIKHGSIKEFDRNDIEMIISMSASFIRFVAKKN